MKVIIAGAGETGTYLAKMLYKAKKDIIIIDLDKEKLSYIDSHFDFITINGSSTSIETLTEAGIKDTNLFISVTEREDTNILSAIIAKKLGAKKVIARIDNNEFLNKENLVYFTEMGIDSMIYPEILAAKEVVNLLNFTGATKTFDFGDGKLSLFAIKLDENAPIINKSLEELTKQQEDFEYRAVAIIRNGETIIPKGSDKFIKDDLFYVICSNKGVDRLMEYSGKQHFHVKNVMIMGGSRIGLKTAMKCESSSYVKLIEKDRLKCELISEQLGDTIIIHGDGRNTELLEEEGLANTDAFVAVTGNSETNILACIHAKKMGVRKTIAEIENMDYLHLANQMSIDTVINKKLIAASHIYSHIMTAQVTSVQCLVATDAEVLEFTVPEKSRITKKLIKDLNFPKNAIIAGVIRGKETFIAKGDTHIQPGDNVIIFALPQAIKKVGKFFN